MKRLKKLNQNLLRSFDSFILNNLNSIIGGITEQTMGTSTTIGADKKLKTCDWTDKRDYTVDKNGNCTYGEPYAFTTIQCCDGLTVTVDLIGFGSIEEYLNNESSI